MEPRSDFSSDKSQLCQGLQTRQPLETLICQRCQRCQGLNTIRGEKAQLALQNWRDEPEIWRDEPEIWRDEPEIWRDGGEIWRDATDMEARFGEIWRDTGLCKFSQFSRNLS